MANNKKTEKVLVMWHKGLQIYCIRHFDETDRPYHLFCKWYEYKSETEFGYHRKQVARYNDMINVLDHIRNFVVNYK